MANKPFEYTIINPLERPTSTDINQLQAQAHYDVRLFADALFGQVDGFLGYSFQAAAEATLDPGKFYMLAGVAFQTEAAENNIGGISGLSDSYEYKAITTTAREITAPAAPTTAGWRRYDLLMVRAPTDSERLKNPTSVGIFNPSLGSFNEATSKYKTLTSSLDEYTMQEIVQPAVGTEPLVYKSGVAGAYADWASTPKPTVDSGYLAVAYIRRFQGQTEILNEHLEDARTLLTVPAQSGGTGNFNLPAGEVLLGNGTSGITSTAILPVSKGGTGNSSTSAPTGSVAWFDNTLDQIKYTQAVTGLYDTPVSGYLLSSNTSGAPTWIAPGAAGRVLMSTGTTWASTEPFQYASVPSDSVSLLGSVNGYDTWILLSDFNIDDVVFNTGIISAIVQPQSDGDFLAYFIQAKHDVAVGSPNVTFRLKVEITGPTTKTFVFPYWVPPTDYQGIPLAPPQCRGFFDAGTYSFRVYAWLPSAAAELNIGRSSFFVSQG